MGCCTVSKPFACNGFTANSAAKEKNTKLSWLAESQTRTSNFQGKAKCSQPFM
jgi:hypothetical protein